MVLYGCMIYHNFMSIDIIDILMVRISFVGFDVHILYSVLIVEYLKLVLPRAVMQIMKLPHFHQNAYQKIYFATFHNYD